MACVLISQSLSLDFLFPFPPSSALTRSHSLLIYLSLALFPRTLTLSLFFSLNVKLPYIPFQHAMADRPGKDINSCSAENDWQRLKEVRESIIQRAPIHTHHLVSSAQSQPQSTSQTRSQSHAQMQSSSSAQPSAHQAHPTHQPQSYPQPQSHTTSLSPAHTLSLPSQPQPSATYYPPPTSRQSHYALPGYPPAPYAPTTPTSLPRPANPQTVPYHTMGTAASRSRPAGGYIAPTITYKPSPFYEPLYQVGEVRTLESTSSPDSLLFFFIFFHLSFFVLFSLFSFFFIFIYLFIYFFLQVVCLFIPQLPQE